MIPITVVKILKNFFSSQNFNFHENCPEFKKYLVLKILIRILTMVLAITGLPNLSIYAQKIADRWSHGMFPF